MNKNNLPVDKQNKILMTNDKWLVSDLFCDPIQVKKDINKI